MANNFKIKKYWIITLCMVLCSLSSFSQELSDATIGFDAGKVMVSLKKHGVKDADLGSGVSRMRENQIKLYYTMEKSKDAIFQNIKTKQTAKITKSKSSKATAATPQELALEKAALIALYNSTNGASWSNVTSGKGAWPVNDPNAIVTAWNPNTNTGWYGISLDSQGRVSYLDLRSNNLVGNLPSQIGALTQVQQILLYTNRLTGPIPPQIGQLKELFFLNLQNNQLSGTIPPQIGSLAKLQTLHLSFNQLSGTLPDEIAQLSALTYLDLAVNQISGTPAQLGSLSKLEVLDISSNQLTGSIPLSLTQLTGLYSLDISSNQLSGEIPTQITSFTRIENLRIDDNNLTGSIPVEIGELTTLYSLSLRSNKLTGSIPSQIGNLKQLRGLDLYNNQLTGSIPTEIGQCTELQNLSLGANQLTGSIPAQIGSLSKLEDLYLSTNQLSGPIPNEIGGCTSLISLYIEQNQITGPLPPQLGLLTQLQSLNLTYNEIDGIIPVEIAQCTELVHLYLEGNQLSGGIPTQLGLLTKLQNLWLGDNRLTGIIPIEIGQCKELDRLHLDSNLLTGTIPTQLTLLTKLTVLRLSNNDLEGKIPDLTGIPLKELTLSGNEFRFTDFPISQFLHYNSTIKNFYYEYQADIDIPITITQTAGTSVTLKMYEDDNYYPNETFQWYKGGQEISGATAREYSIPNLKVTDAATYFCQAKHPQMTISQHTPNPVYGRYLALNRAPVTLEVLPGACISVTGEIIAPATILTGNNIHFTFNTTSSQVLTYFWTCYNLDNNIVGNSTSNYIDQIYNAVGNYKVELKVKDENECETTFTKIITVAQNCIPVTGEITLLGKVILNEPLGFSFYSMVSALTYNWTFYNLDGTVKDTQSNTGSVATQTYDTIGDYKIKLTATRIDGCSYTFEKIINVSLPPVCEENESRSGTIRISSNNTYEQYGLQLNKLTNLTFYKYWNVTNGPLTYEWKLYNSNGTLLNSNTTKDFPIIIEAIGEYKVKLRLTDTIGCTEYENTLYVRDPNNCIIPSDTRGGTIYTPENKDVILEDSQSVMTFAPNGFSTTNFTYKWDLIDATGHIVTTSNDISFIAQPTKGKYQINLQIKDPNGCTTQYTRNVETVDICTYTKDDDQFSLYAENEYMSGRVSFLNIGEKTTITPTFSGHAEEDFTYSWKLYNPAGNQIATGNNYTFPVTVNESGYHKVTLDVTSIATGCVTTGNKTINGLIRNGCAANNEKSAEVKELYLIFLKKLLIRSFLGETDAQINATVASPEFMALKPYIKNGVGDKIYNFVSTRLNEEHVNSINFSFSPDREFDVHIYDSNGMYYYPEYNSLEDLNTIAEGIIYTDISQYITADDYFVSCYVRNESKRKKTAKVVLDPYECTTESEVRNIIFCPGEGNNCTPSIVGTIKSGSENIYPNAQASFTFETTVPNLTYTWSVVSETGEVLSTSNSGITDPYLYTFATDGNYRIKLIAKNETGCTENFTKNIIVDNKRCANEANNFTFETAVTNATYVWSTTNSTGNIVDTVTNTTGTYSFTTSISGQYEVKLVANAGENCETIFAKTIVVENCNTTISCTQNSPMTPKVHSLFIALINKLVTTPNGTDVNRYALNEIISLASYTTSSRSRIFNFVNNSTAVSFSFSQNGVENDVFLPKSASGTILGIDLSKYFGSQGTTQVITNYSDGSNNPAGGFVRNIDFCPAVECLPTIGKINISRSNGTSKSSTSTHSKI